MPNTIKYSTTGDTQSLKKGNFYFGVGDVGKGPTSGTSYWNGITPPTSGYTIYINKSSNGPSMYVATGDTQLINFTKGFSGQNFTGATQCLNWYLTQSNYACVNRDYESIVTSGLTLCLDAGFTPSYTSSGTTWYDVSYGGNNGTLVNGPTFNSENGGSIVFDGVDDYVRVLDNNSLDISNNITIECWFYPTSYKNPESYSIPLFNKYSGTTDANFRFYFAGSFQINKLVIYATRGGVWNPVSPISQVIPLNQWTHIVWTYSNGGLLYINGVSQGSAVGSGNLSTNNVNLNIGDGYAGRISNIRIYNVALTQTNVTQNYNALKDRFGL